MVRELSREPAMFQIGLQGEALTCVVLPQKSLSYFRESETTIKIKFALFRGGWAGGQGGKLSKTLFFVGNATTIKFRK